jgi:predicted alpha/beta superfamily hydrolase
MTDPAAAPAPPESAAPEPPHTITGDVRLHEGFHSRSLPDDRAVAVWLPPGYAADDVSRFPVLYLQDGQNLFDRATAFGDEWRVDETAQGLVEAGEVEPLIVVGVYNTGDRRVDEYTPARDEAHARGGEADAYGRLLVEELKPFIDRTYRTLPSAGNTGIGGSSLGGLVALHVGLRYPTAFGKIAALSPSVWWADRAILRTVDALPYRPPVRIWLDAGTLEGGEVVADARRLRDALVHKGWRVGDDLAYAEVEGARHDEAAWAARAGDVLRWLYPPKRRPFERAAQAFRRWRDRLRTERRQHPR